MSRFRVNPALIVGAMVGDVIEKTVDEKTGTMMRPVQLNPLFQSKYAKPGCRSAGCRLKGKCICECKVCKLRCSHREVRPTVDERGIVHLIGPDGKTIAFFTKEEYEKYRIQWETRGVPRLEDM